jgi:hypothetical protein
METAVLITEQPNVPGAAHIFAGPGFVDHVNDEDAVGILRLMALREEDHPLWRLFNLVATRHFDTGPKVRTLADIRAALDELEAR